MQSGNISSGTLWKPLVGLLKIWFVRSNSIVSLLKKAVHRDNSISGGVSRMAWALLKIWFARLNCIVCRPRGDIGWVSTTSLDAWSTASALRKI
jgi:hypothetical protein